MPNNDSHQHVVKTSEQWNDRAVEFWVVPRGCLCIELTPKKKTLLKIGEGNKYYAQLPYVTSDADLSNYYTKEEVDNIINNINRMAIMSTEEYDSKRDLPLTGNKLGDVRFVKSQSPSIKIDPDIYLWNGIKWIFVGYEIQDIDLRDYLKKEEFHALFDPVKSKVETMWPMRHTHNNLDVLNRIEAPYTNAEKDKLASLRNYDSEIELISSDIDSLKADQHHHDNKAFLDTITEEYQIWSVEDREKFDNIPDYHEVIEEMQSDINELEEKSHTHGIDGKGTLDILNQIEEPYTTEEKEKLATLKNYKPFNGTDGMLPGRAGLVPAPATSDLGKFLSSDGTWQIAGGSDINNFIGATDTTDGERGLVPAPLMGQETYFLCGNGMWQPLPYEAGIGLTLGTPYTHNENTDIPETYLQIEYLESTGTQYIDFPSLATDNNVEITIDFSITHIVDDTWISGNGNSWYGYLKGLGMTTTEFKKPDADTTYDPDVLQEGLRVIGKYETNESYQNVYIFARSDMYGSVRGNSQCRIYTMSTLETHLYQSTHHLFPVIRKSDNVPGMYDTDDGVFYTNNGTGDFLCGPEKTVTEYIDGNVFNVNVGEGLSVDSNNFINVDVMVGATQYVDGSSGTVPQPLTTDVDKFLKGDGTWAAPTFELSPATTSTLGGVIVGDGLTVDQTGNVDVNIGTGLSFNPITGAIDVVGGGGGGSSQTYAEGQGIDITQGSPSGLPSSYTEVEYIGNTGSSYIATDYVPTTNTSIEIITNIHKGSSSWQCLFGARDGVYPGGYEYAFLPSVNGNYHFYPRITGDVYGYMPYETYDEKIRININGTQTVVTKSDSTSYSYTQSGSLHNLETTMNIFAMHNGNINGDFSISDVYSFKIYENDSLIRNFVPCYRNSDNVAGFYETENDVFYTNQGSGTFTVGNQVAVSLINADIGDGLIFDSNNAIAINIGTGLSLNQTTGALQVDEMVGADGTHSGTAGDVPAPISTDNANYLRGDATWNDPIEDFRTRVNNGDDNFILVCENPSSS